MAFRKHLSGQKGFTLIELLVVVAILGILAGIAVPRVIGAIDNARARKADADLVTLRDALERFYLDYGVFPMTLKGLQERQYIDPNFNFKNSYGFFYFYAVELEGDYSAGGTLNIVNTNDFKDYVLGDPGQIPAAPEVDAETPANALYTGRNSPDGTDPLTAAVNNARFWGTGSVPAVSFTVNIKDYNGVAATMAGQLVICANNLDPGPATWARYKGK